MLEKVRAKLSKTAKSAAPVEPDLAPSDLLHDSAKPGGSTDVHDADDDNPVSDLAKPTGTRRPYPENALGLEESAPSKLTAEVDAKEAEQLAALSTENQSNPVGTTQGVASKTPQQPTWTADNPPPKSRGGLLFDIATYAGLGWVVNTVVSVFLSDRAQHGRLQIPVDKAIDKTLTSSWFEKISVGSPEVQAKADTVNKAVWDHYFDTHGFQDHFQPTEDIKVCKGHFHHTQAEKMYYRLQEGGAKFADIAGDLNKASANDNALKGITEADLKKARTVAIKLTNRHAKAGSMVMLGLLIAGGYMIMMPIKWMEDAKAPLVNWLDKRFGKPNQTDLEKEEVEAYHEYLDHEPQQSWASILSGRCMSICTILAGYFAMNAPRNVVTALHSKSKGKLGNPDKPFFKGYDHYADELGKLGVKGAESTMPGFTNRVQHRLEEVPLGLEARFGSTRNENGPFRFVPGDQRMRKLAKTTVDDVIIGGVAAELTYLYSKMLAPFFSEPDNTFSYTVGQNNALAQEAPVIHTPVSESEEPKETEIANTKKQKADEEKAPTEEVIKQEADKVKDELKSGITSLTDNLSQKASDAIKDKVNGQGKDSPESLVSSMLHDGKEELANKLGDREEELKKGLSSNLASFTDRLSDQAESAIEQTI